jgi:hypothetical protein
VPFFHQVDKQIFNEVMLFAEEFQLINATPQDHHFAASVMQWTQATVIIIPTNVYLIRLIDLRASYRFAEAKGQKNMFKATMCTQVAKSHRTM